jgi:hypothetical protein
MLSPGPPASHAERASRQLADVLVSQAIIVHQEQGHNQNYLKCRHSICANTRAQIQKVGLAPQGGNTAPGKTWRAADTRSPQLGLDERS